MGAQRGNAVRHEVSPSVLHGRPVSMGPQPAVPAAPPNGLPAKPPLPPKAPPLPPTAPPLPPTAPPLPPTAPPLPPSAAISRERLPQPAASPTPPMTTKSPASLMPRSMPRIAHSFARPKIRVPGGTLAVTQTLPPMVEPWPITVSPPKMVAPE